MGRSPRLDSNIDHSHPSFADIGDDDNDHRNPLGSGVYKGECMDAPALCDDKRISSMYDDMDAGSRDDDKHGSHTARTAGATSSMISHGSHHYLDHEQLRSDPMPIPFPKSPFLRHETLRRCRCCRIIDFKADTLPSLRRKL